MVEALRNAPFKAMTEPLRSTSVSSTTAPSPPPGFVEKTPLERYLPPAKPSLVGLSRAQLTEALATVGVAAAQRKMRVQQISADGTRKWLLRLADGHSGERPHEIECVYIPEADRGTLCLSSQVGCTLTCPFCHTGTQRLVRNLTPGEIVGQIMVARDRLDDWLGAGRPAGEPAGAQRMRQGGQRLVSNIVMMGMGEPLYNFDAVRDALLIAADGEGIAISKRRITLSTSGVVPNISRAGKEIGCMLAVSLHAARNELRNELVPLNRKYPIEDLLQACREYPGLSNARRITFEYVMLRGVNDSVADAKALVKLLKGIPAKINLIPFNPWPGSRYECSDWERIEKFSE